MPSPRPLDRIDRRILALLQNDARLSNKELAARIGLAPSSCHTRLQRLIAEGTLEGFAARVRPEALGIGIEAMVSVRLGRHARESLDAFREHVLGLREVVDVFHLAGSTDLLIHVVVRDTEHLRTLTLDELSSRPEVDRLETALVFARWTAPAMPDFVDDASDD
ncbi:MAG: Lrp/AsnC family transcriptional regulator [Planctomycetes bacterium]|nr:Lrp/AsnC family transcriptional regulator [Planctomycetota bacterium]